MNPDSAETRLGRLERAVAKVEQRVEDVMTIALAGLREDLQECGAAVRGLRVEVEADRKMLRDREESQRRERILDRRWMIGTVLASASLVIAAMALLLNTGA